MFLLCVKILNNIICMDEDIINCVKKFLKMGLIYERIQNGQTEYVISEKGRNNINC